MLPELWINISKYLNEKDIQKLIKMKILSNEYICKICSFEREIVIEDKIYYKYSFFDTQIGLERTIKKICGLYINNICSNCGHIKNKKIKAQKIKGFYDERLIKQWKERYQNLL
jgi:hypothetical protein